MALLKTPTFLMSPINEIKRYVRFQKTIRESIKWHHEERDLVELKRTKIPKTEKIELHCVWATEAFTPSGIDGLLKSLARLGWDKSDSDSRQNLSDWIRQGRSLGRRSSWNNGGIILRRGDNRFMTADKKYSRLPTSADYARLSLRNITPSLTLVTVQFVLNDEAASSFNKVLSSEDYKTYVRYYPNRLKIKRASYIGIEFQKREAAKAQFDKIHSEIYEWFRKNLPGYYSGLDSFKPMPMLDFLTSRKYIQPEETRPRIRDHYTGMLFDYSSDIWKGDSNPALELRIANNVDHPSTVLFGNYNVLIKDSEVYGGKDRHALTSKFDSYLSETIDLLATHNLLISQERSLSQIRDKASSKIKSMRKALADINNIRDNFLKLSKDTQSIGRDIGESGIAKYIYDKSEAADFKNPFYYRDVSRPNLIETLREQDELRAKELLASEKHVKEVVTSSGNLASTIANMRIQRYVFWLTIAAALFAFVAIYPTVSAWWADVSNWATSK